MDYLKTDEEQGEALKRWLAQNGLGLVVAIGVGLVLFGLSAVAAAPNQSAIGCCWSLSRVDRTVSD